MIWKEEEGKIDLNYGILFEQLLSGGSSSEKSERSGARGWAF